MAIEIQKHYYETVIQFVDDVSKYYSLCNTRGALKTRSALLAATAETSTKIKTFLEFVTTQSKSSESAKAISGFNSMSKKLLKLLTAISTGISTQQINSLTALRKTALPEYRALLLDVVAYAKRYVPSNVQPEDLEQHADFQKKLGASINSQRILQHAAKSLKSTEPEETDEEKQLRVSDANAVKLLSGYKKLTSKLPSSLQGKLFTAVQLPVVPYIDYSLLSPKFLRTTGVPFQNIANSFIVLEEQYLLAFDFVHATTNDEGSRRAVSLKATKSTLNARKRASEQTQMQENFILSVLDRLNASAQEEYTLMSSHFEHHPNNGRIAFAWIVPKRVQRMFARKGDLSDAAWGFPWDKRATSIL